MDRAILQLLTALTKLEPLTLAIFFLGMMGLGALWIGVLAMKTRGRK